MIDRPDAPGLNDSAAAWRGAYLHIPFCSKVCPYCDFAVVEGRADQFDPYLEALATEIAAEPDWGPLDAVHFGGGTPSVLSVDSLTALLGAVGAGFGLAAGCEVAIEANPEDWSQAFADGLAWSGFDRVSFGSQSFDPAVLERLGRQHAPADTSAAVAQARAAGFRSINIDLIYGTPGESLDSWSTTLDRALAAEPDHLSTYALTVERGTPLSVQVAGGAPAPDADLQAEMYETACELAAAAGLVRYEVSNFARPGHAARYNLLTWAQGEYLGFGTGAHSHRDGTRRRNVRRLDAYMGRVAEEGSAVAGSEQARGWEAEIERVFLGLRRASGVIGGPVGRALLDSDWGRTLAAAGVLASKGDRIRVARPLMADEASRAVLALSAIDC